jgi:D-alanyl-D-alanine carboxypeptidase
MEGYVFYGGKKHKPRRKRARRLGITVLFVVFFAVLAAAAYGLLGRFGGQDDPLACLAQNSAGPAAVQEGGLPAESGDRTDTGERSQTDWNLILVNKWNLVPDVYDMELTQLSNGETVDTRIYPALQAMFDAARADGVYPIVAAGYRSAEKQQSLWDEKLAELEAAGYTAADAKKEAETWVAVPGTSEHQLGLAVDINADGVQSAGFEVYEWLEENAWTYGFILRYPADKTDITGVGYEPWHYRYVGREAAESITRQGLCLEEYVSTMQ